MRKWGGSTSAKISCDKLNSEVANKPGIANVCTSDENTSLESCAPGNIPETNMLSKLIHIHNYDAIYILLASRPGFVRVVIKVKTSVAVQTDFILFFIRLSALPLLQYF